jgi:cytochrome bd-type quinol oxidase subunit 2
MRNLKKYMLFTLLAIVVVACCISQLTFNQYIPESWQYHNLPHWIQIPILGIAVVIVVSSAWEIWSNLKPSQPKQSKSERL